MADGSSDELKGDREAWRDLGKPAEKPDHRRGIDQDLRNWQLRNSRGFVQGHSGRHNNGPKSR